MWKTRSYRELVRLLTFEERFEYLKLNGTVGRVTFGFERYLNQSFYRSSEWRNFRRDMIVRDNGCDLALPDREIFRFVTLHHINPITPEDIEASADCVLDPDNVICTSDQTHRAIHYGDISLLPQLPQERRKGDTTLWTVY